MASKTIDTCDKESEMWFKKYIESEIKNLKEVDSLQAIINNKNKVYRHNGS